MVTGGWDYPQTALGDSLVYPENLSMSYVHLSWPQLSLRAIRVSGGLTVSWSCKDTPALQYTRCLPDTTSPHALVLTIHIPQSTIHTTPFTLCQSFSTVSLEMLKAATKFSFIVRKMNKFNQRGKLYRRLLRWSVGTPVRCVLGRKSNKWPSSPFWSSA